MPNTGQQLKTNYRTQIRKWYMKNYSFLALYKKIKFNNQKNKNLEHIFNKTN